MSNAIDSTPVETKDLSKTHFLNDFLGFIQKYGVVGLALGVVIGQSVTKLTTSLVSNIITPIIGLLPSFKSLVDLNIAKDSTGHIGFNLKGDGVSVILGYGQFLTDALDFIIIMAVVYFAIKFLIGRFMTEAEETSVKTK